MKKILFLIPLASLMVVFFLWQNKTEAQSCEMKYVCVDDKHVGLQTTDCKVISADEMMPNSKTYCTVSCKDGKCIDDKKPATCVDSDKGKDYLTKGTATLNDLGMFSEMTDSCADANNLTEVSCKQNESVGFNGMNNKYLLSSENYKCPNGCKDGACVKSSAANKCEDSDGGKNIMKPGEIKINGKSVAKDSLDFDFSKIKEYYCKPDGTYGSEAVTCPGAADFNSKGAFCLNDCKKTTGWKCVKGKSVYSIAYITKDCKQTRIVPCESNACSTDKCVSNLATKQIDTDGDGLLDVNEKKYGTNPKKFDTDKDGFGDKEEIMNGFNPLGTGKLKNKK